MVKKQSKSKLKRIERVTAQKRLTSHNEMERSENDSQGEMEDPKFEKVVTENESDADSDREVSFLCDIISQS